MKPPEIIIKYALDLARKSPCRSKRGVVVYVEIAGLGPFVLGQGFNGPPAPFACPGREVCAGTCGRRSVHAEMRALRNRPPEGMKVELVHVELAADGSGVVACDGPRCEQCSREILDVGFVAGVWLFELGTPPDELADAARRGIAVLMRHYWRRYTAEEFHRVTLQRCGLTP